MRFFSEAKLSRDKDLILHAENERIYSHCTSCFGFGAKNGGKPWLLLYEVVGR